jgi:hypothetical protein
MSTKPRIQLNLRNKHKTKLEACTRLWYNCTEAWRACPRVLSQMHAKYRNLWDLPEIPSATCCTTHTFTIQGGLSLRHGQARANRINTRQAVPLVPSSGVCRIRLLCIAVPPHTTAVPSVGGIGQIKGWQLGDFYLFYRGIYCIQYTTRSSSFYSSVQILFVNRKVCEIKFFLYVYYLARFIPGLNRDN